VTPRVDPESGKYFVGVLIRESLLVKSASESGVESEIERLSSKFVDAEGKEICRCVVDFDTRETIFEDIFTTRGQRIKKYSLLYSQDGVEKEYDILENFNPDNVPVYIGNNQLVIGGGYHDYLSNRVVTFANNTPSSLFLTLHELGHYAGGHNPDLHKFKRFYDIQNDYKFFPVWTSDMIYGLIPDLEYIVDNTPGGVANIDMGAVSEGLQPFIDELAKIQSERHTDKASAKYKEWREKITILQKNILSFEVKKGVTVFDILCIPTAIIERDAEYRAILATKKIKKDTGIDLFKKFPAPKPDENLIKKTLR
jgi:hypothetical protein